MQYVENCIVCGSKSNKMVLEPTFFGNVAEASSYFLAHRKAVAHGRVVRCTKCDFTFTSPQFEPGEYHQIYSAAASCEPEDDSFWKAEMLRGCKLAKIVKKYRPNGGCLLDFGCGQGGFLAAIDGFDKIGFEVGKARTQVEDSAAIITGEFLKMTGRYPFLPASYDVVTVFDVFEHLPNLDIYLRALTDLIRPSGLLILTVPNTKSMGAKIMGSRWSMFLLEHLWYFAPSTLKTFVEKSGYQCVDISSVSYTVPFSHIMNRAAQTFGLSWLKRLGASCRTVLPVPVGLMCGIFRKN